MTSFTARSTGFSQRLSRSKSSTLRFRRIAFLGRGREASVSAISESFMKGRPTAKRRVLRISLRDDASERFNSLKNPHGGYKYYSTRFAITGSYSSVPLLYDKRRFDGVTP